MMTATILVLLDIRLLAIASGAYFKALAASRTRWRVDGFIFEAGYAGQLCHVDGGIVAAPVCALTGILDAVAGIRDFHKKNPPWCAE